MNKIRKIIIQITLILSFLSCSNSSLSEMRLPGSSSFIFKNIQLNRFTNTHKKYITKFSHVHKNSIQMLGFTAQLSTNTIAVCNPNNISNDKEKDSNSKFNNISFSVKIYFL